jgi:multidrug efflux pump subunit AcrA (membrane-fusion protein)
MKALRTCVAGLAVAALAWPGIAVANPNGEPVLERCLVSLADEAKVPAQEAGVLVELSVREGDKVTKGQVIARIADDQPQMEKRRAKAEFDQAAAKAESDVDVRYSEKAEGVSQKAYEKAEQSHRSVQGAVTEVERDRLKLEWEKTSLQIEQAQLERRLAALAAESKQTEVDAAEKAIERRQIRSPIDGVIEDLAKHQGEWMQPGDMLAHVLRTDTLRVEGYIDAAKWDPAEVRDRPVTVSVTLANGRQEQFTGRIVFVSERVESGGDYRVYADVPNRRAGPAGEWLLRAGQAAKMTIHSQQPPATR